MSKGLSKINQTDVTSALKKINEELSKMKENQTAPTQTHGRFKYNQRGSWEERIFNIEDVSELLSIVSFLNAKEKGHNEAGEEMGLKQFPVFTWQSYTVNQWKSDIKRRIESLSYKERKSNLLEAKSQMERYVSEETRFQSTLESIKSLIS